MDNVLKPLNSRQCNEVFPSLPNQFNFPHCGGTQGGFKMRIFLPFVVQR